MEVRRRRESGGTEEAWRTEGARGRPATGHLRLRHQSELLVLVTGDGEVLAAAAASPRRQRVLPVATAPTISTFSTNCSCRPHPLWAPPTSKSPPRSRTSSMRRAQDHAGRGLRRRIQQQPKMLGCFHSLMKDFKKQIWMQRMISSFIYAVRQGQWNTAVRLSSLHIVAIDLTYSFLIFFNVTTTPLITVLCYGESDEQSKPSSNTGIIKPSMLLVPSEVVTEINIAEESEKCTSENGVMPVDGNSCDIGMPYAPENWPCPGDQWSWKVGCRASVTGHWLDRWFTTQINLLIWLRRRNCKIGLITTSSSMREIHQKGPPTRLAFLAVLVLRWMPLNTTKQRLRRLRKKNLMNSQLFQ